MTTLKVFGVNLLGFIIGIIFMIIPIVCFGFILMIVAKIAQCIF